ncbi:hypothetical protein TNCT_615881 [Trichonephila clavata]|uniref:Uncharacterized protein n=1 Tax=Trichonephila clavata TaxID=2740835 RepID=A0A8X6FGQ3_TRICU|nr:hypothetical protein TNCT_615881 [Trichonephila clavata]
MVGITGVEFRNTSDAATSRIISVVAEVSDVETTAMLENIYFSHDGISKGKKSCVFFPKVNHLHSECVLAQMTSGGSSLIGSEGFSKCGRTPNATNYIQI